MRLVTFTHKGRTGWGRLEGEQIIDLSALYPDMMALLAAGDAGMQAAGKAKAKGDALKLADVELQSPVPRPSKILAVGLNYADHLKEVQDAGSSMATPQHPMIFNKQASSINGPYAPIYLPPESALLDYEAELAIIIGKRCRRVPKARAMEVVAGSAICNDVTIRDWQLRTPTMTMGKSWDSHCPLGPALVTPDEVDPSSIDFRLLVNGEERQKSNTRHLIFDIPTLVEHLSTAFTLEPGDIIATGTTSGVAAMMEGMPWLKEGDVVRIEMDGLGFIENTVVKEDGKTIIG